MNDQDKAKLAELETIVENGIANWQETAKALAEIHANAEFWQPKSFADYAQERFGLSKQMAYSYLSSGKILIDLGDNATTKKLKEGHCREFAGLGKDDKAKLLDSLKNHKKITAEVIAKKREELFAPPAPPVEEKPEGETEDKPEEKIEIKSGWEVLLEEYERLTQLPEEANQELSDLRQRFEYDKEEVLTVPYGSTFFVVLLDDNQHKVHRYRWDEDQEMYLNP